MAVLAGGPRPPAAPAPRPRSAPIAPVRAFVALPLSPELQGRLDEVAAPLRAIAPRASWVRRGNFHLTLRFLGDVEADRLRAIGDALAAAAACVNGFELALRGLGAFPTAAQPRIVWVGASGENLGALAAAVDRALEQIGIPREARAFSGHVTLGRLRVERGARSGRRGGPSELRALAEALGAGAAVEVGRTRVSHIALVQSQLAPGGSVYTELRTAPLA